jgi:hypothetical protein
MMLIDVAMLYILFVVDLLLIAVGFVFQLAARIT